MSEQHHRCTPACIRRSNPRYSLHDLHINSLLILCRLPFVICSFSRVHSTPALGRESVMLDRIMTAHSVSKLFAEFPFRDRSERISKPKPPTEPIIDQA